MIDIKKEVKSALTNATGLIQRKSDEIADDLENEKVTEIVICISIKAGEVPTTKISKSYSNFSEEV